MLLKFSMVSIGRLTLMETLKKAVRDSHGRMEALPFFQALTRDQLPLASYVGQLRALAIIHGALEHELALLPASGASSLMADRPSRLVHLRKDLSGLEPMFIPDITAALPHALGIADQIRRYRVERPADLLGVMYVLEGSSLGNKTLLPCLLRNFGALAPGTAHYYQAYGSGTAQHWVAFCAAMNAFPVDVEGQRHIVQAALDLFDRMGGLYAALFPIHEADTVFSATMLNPEAGDHPVPQDLRALKAAVTAAVKCHDEFPYFNERFKERGREFAKSDVAWLATLVDLPESQVIGQVEWLGQILGNRGIPRLTLERQLILLQEELAVAWPERAHDFRILREAAPGAVFGHGVILIVTVKPSKVSRWMVPSHLDRLNEPDDASGGGAHGGEIHAAHGLSFVERSLDRNPCTNGLKMSGTTFPWTPFAQPALVVPRQGRKLGPGSHLEKGHRPRQRRRGQRPD